MIKCYLLDGIFKESSHNDFNQIRAKINNNRRELYQLKPEIIIEILTALSKKIIRDKSINKVPGATYVALWLRSENLKRIYRINYGKTSYLEDFQSFEDYFELYAQPRGVVCQWVAGNIPTLSFFSLIQVILSRNGSIVKVPEENQEFILSLLRLLNDIHVEINGKKYSGKIINRSVAIVSFEGKNYNLSKEFSLVADVKIVWGSAEAINAINSLPQREHCETIIFGPKYSFGVFDRGFIESDTFDNALDYAVKDVVLFNQMACSSPHVFFFERSRYSLKEIAEKMKSSFENLPQKLLNEPLPQNIALEVINTRGIYLLSTKNDILKSDDLSWTVLLNQKTGLEEPVQGKCIFLKEINDINDVLYFITPKIQAISIGTKDPSKKYEFARNATYNGADRITSPGKMHDFDLPWDGIMTLNRLVRWAFIKD